MSLSEDVDIRFLFQQLLLTPTLLCKLDLAIVIDGLDHCSSLRSPIETSLTELLEAMLDHSCQLLFTSTHSRAVINILSPLVDTNTIASYSLANETHISPQRVVAGSESENPGIYYFGE